MEQYKAAEKAIQSALVDADIEQRIGIMEALSRLAQVAGKPYAVGKHFLAFLEAYTPNLEALRDGESIADRAAHVRRILNCFARAGVTTERLRLLYLHIERDFPEFESMGALLPMPDAVNLLHTMLSTGLSSAQAVQVLLKCALRDPLMHYKDDSVELRKLKMIEMLLRVDFLHTQETLAWEVLEYLSVVRSLRYYDRELRRETPLSYQLAFFLRKHSFPAKRHMVGPYGLKVCDPEARVNFEPVEDRTYRLGLVEEPAVRKGRHLEAIGWRHVPVDATDWDALQTYEAKAEHVRNLLKENDLLDL